MMCLRKPAAALVAAMVVLTVVAAAPVAATDHESVSVETVAAVDVTEEEATIRGNLTELENASSAELWIEYWEEGDPANASTTENLTATEVGEFEIGLAGLDSNTTYVAVTHADTGNVSDEGAPVTFTTAEEPVPPLGVETDEATDVTNTSATLNGVLTGLDGEDSASVWFEYWEAGDPANATLVGAQTLSEPDAFNHSLSGLENDTDYVYAAFAEANGTTVSGENVSFTTADGADDGEGPPAVEDKHPFGQWIQTWLHDLLNGADTVSPIGQMISEMVVANNPGADHRSDKANPGGNGNGPPAHAKGGDKAKGPQDGDDDDADGALDVTVEGDVANGSTVTVNVTHEGDPVEGANVSLNGDHVGTTDADGQLDVTLPDPLGEEVVISAEYEDLEGEWEHEA